MPGPNPHDDQAAGEPVELIATFRARAEHLPRVREMIGDYGVLVRAEPGNQRFEAYQDAVDAHEFVVIERYVDQAAFKAHLNAPKGIPFNEELDTLIEGTGSALQFLRRV